MSDNNGEIEEKLSYVTVQFKEIGSAICVVKYDNITPEQLLLATELLDLYAKNEFIAKQQQLAKQKLMIPEQRILKPS